MPNATIQAVFLAVLFIPWDKIKTVLRGKGDLRDQALSVRLFSASRCNLTQRSTCTQA